LPYISLPDTAKLETTQKERTSRCEWSPIARTGIVGATLNIGNVLEGSSRAHARFATFSGATSSQNISAPAGASTKAFVAIGTHLYALFSNCNDGTAQYCVIHLEHSTLSARHWRGVVLSATTFSALASSPQMSAYGENIFISGESKRGAVRCGAVRCSSLLTLVALVSRRP
jgi:hypothetical protein